jgi:hypothetical protein
VDLRIPLSDDILAGVREPLSTHKFALKVTEDAPLPWLFVDRGRKGSPGVSGELTGIKHPFEVVVDVGE